MLTDLYLSGHLQDNEGTPYPSSGARPDDPVLLAAFDRIGGTRRRTWAKLIAENHNAPGVVRDQLEAIGWLCVQRRRMLGIIPTARVVGLYDEDVVSGLAARVTEALANAIDKRPGEPRPLAVGLLAVQADARGIRLHRELGAAGGAARNDFCRN